MFRGRVSRHNSQIVLEKRRDRRAQNTADKIDAAFVDLLFRKPYDAIRVSELAKRAHVGRATFYKHYADKDALLRSQLDRIVVPMLAPLNEPCLIDATALFEHVRASRRLLRTIALSRAAQPVIQASFESHVAHTLSNKKRAFVSGITASIGPRFISSTLQALVTWWMQEGMQRSPRQMQEIFAALVGRGVWSL